MTIIVALHDPFAGTWIGADSRMIVGQGYVMPAEVRKWVRVGGGVVGVAGSARTATLVRQFASVLGTMAETPENLAEAMRLLFDTKGYRILPDEGKSGPGHCGSDILYATPDGVWDIGWNFAVVRVRDGCLWARGSGMDHALGADYALCRDKRRRGLYPEQRIEAALDAAAHFDAACAGPMLIERIEDGAETDHGSDEAMDRAVNG